MKRVLIVSSSSELDYFTPFLRAAEQHGGLDVVVLDTDRFPSECKISVSMTCRGEIDGALEVMRFDAVGTPVAESVPIRSIEVAWHLRARAPTSKQMRSVVECQFATDESAYALRALQTVAPWRWINTREAVRKAENNKLYQQMIAAECGLAVPETTASNDPSVVQGFAAKDEKLLLKTFGFPAALKDGRVCYSNIFSEEELRGVSSAIAECPVYSQRYVEKKYEYRVMVMVIGTEVHACRIDSQASERTRVDWRYYDYDKVSHVAVTLPDVVNAALLRFMQRMNLRYGAIDMIERPDGTYVFLEVNPSGQWGWIHHLVQVPIPEAVARMLAAA